ncbi:M20/M25/M40 family metallo-hydrolase [Mesoterricola silvestris]|uniref:Peptidase n=1 Tax=Mesoterricola silvestris TaxID=2927979 RepID=A0AA48K7B8_9BACT|nr:M20/M25/M40 family metallo-hydrolase [Mesoterricola silvestris]BDU71000.1 peptidase [Mesoterricola silvestris]
MNADALTREALAAFAQAKRQAFEAELRTLVEIPSVSSDPDRAADIRRCAEAAVDLFRRHGGEATLLETEGNPLVLGRFDLDPALPTLTVYNHMDVQPANEPEWTTEPFRMEIAGDTYRGRGTTDDKGPALSAFFGALAAREAGVPLNVHFLWELEEEIGSPSFRGGLERHKDLLGTQAIVVSDTVWLTRGKPSTPAGLRGLKGFRLTLETASHDLHSGVVGGAARNPLAELMGVVAAMVDGHTGKVKIPHFYRKVVKPSRKELKEWAHSGFSVETFMADHEIHSLRTGNPLKVMKRIWGRPTMEVHGVVGGYTGPGIKSAVPPRAEVKMSCRLVPDMDEASTFDLIRTFLATHYPDVQLHEEHGLAPFKGHVSGPYAEAVKDAYAFAFGAPCRFTREGGSIGAVKTMEDVLGCEVYFLGLSLPSHGYHAPNENYDWEQASGGIAAFARYFQVVSGF